MGTLPEPMRPYYMTWRLERQWWDKLLNGFPEDVRNEVFEEVRKGSMTLRRKSRARAVLDTVRRTAEALIGERATPAWIDFVGAALCLLELNYHDQEAERAEWAQFFGSGRRDNSDSGMWNAAIRNTASELLNGREAEFFVEHGHLIIELLPLKDKEAPYGAIIPVPPPNTVLRRQYIRAIVRRARERVRHPSIPRAMGQVLEGLHGDKKAVIS